MRLCINTQTPPFRLAGPGDTDRSGSPSGRYVANVGGVVPMMRALLAASLGRWIDRPARWVALGAPGAPRELSSPEGFVVEHVDLSPLDRRRYARFKDSVWYSFHGPGFPEFARDDYRSFLTYSHRTADVLLAHLDDTDLYYVNDFQQLLIGGLIGSAAPAVLRWHIPLELAGYPEPVRRFFLRSMEGFDAIVVSTRAGLEELVRSGYHGRAHQLYPYVDPRDHAEATPREVAAFRERYGLGEAPVILSVARLDPVKRQDLLVRAFASIRRKFPSARLVLVGGGSFSTMALGTDPRETKRLAWQRRLDHVIRRHRLEGSVVLTGSVTPAERNAAYSAASVFVHPAPWEGFGLVAIEAWIHGLPVVVSQGAGVAELVDDGLNGFTTPPGSVRAIAHSIERLLRRPGEAERLGAAGRLTARRCYIGRAIPRLKAIFSEAIDLYHSSGLRQPSTRRWGR